MRDHKTFSIFNEKKEQLLFNIAKTQMMKYFRLLFLALIMACSSPKVVYDYDTAVDFSQFKTYDFFEDAGEGLNELDKKRIMTAIAEKLAAKGMQRQTQPQIYIHILSKQVAVEDRNTVGVGIGGGGGNVGFGISGGIPIGAKKVNRQVTIDFVNAKNNQLIWQGVGEGKIKEKTTPEEREAFYTAMAAKILAGYPPKKTSK